MASYPVPASTGDAIHGQSHRAPCQNHGLGQTSRGLQLDWHIRAPGSQRNSQRLYQSSVQLQEGLFYLHLAFAITSF
jgi:hypothetical protein